MTLLIACVSMAFKDAFGTGLMLSESRVAIWFAAAFDALSDWANFVVTSYTAVPLHDSGWTFHNVSVLGAVSLTSFCGTAAWTYIGDRYIPKARGKKRLHPWLHHPERWKPAPRFAT